MCTHTHTHTHKHTHTHTHTATIDIFSDNGATTAKTINMNPLWSKYFTIIIKKQDGTAWAVQLLPKSADYTVL